MAHSFIPFQRIVSDASVYVRETRDEAVAAALAGVDPSGSVTYGNMLNVWPAIAKYDAPNNDPFNLVDNPQYIWSDTNCVPSERLAFAKVCNVLPRNTDLAIFLATFADNAHTTHIELYTNDELTFSISNELVAGNMSANTEESPPFNWQNVRFYTNKFTTPNVPLSTFKLVLSFEVQNYVSTMGNDKTPAGLMFLADLYYED